MKFTFIFSSIAFALYLVIVTVKVIQFNQNCGGHLTLAANSNTIELATKELEIATNYMKRKKLTHGYTSILWKTPKEDVGFWYENITVALKELKEMSPDATPLEKSNVLMKLRESITENGEKGENLNVPNGIALYPNNKLFALFGWLSFLPFVGCILIVAIE
jgi:hypothetical protein